MKTSTTTPSFVRSVLATFESASNPGHKHEVRMGADGNVYCTCPSWRFQKTNPLARSCKHTVATLRHSVHGGHSVATAGVVADRPVVRPTRSRPATSRYSRV